MCVSLRWICPKNSDRRDFFEKMRFIFFCAASKKKIEKIWRERVI